MKKARKTPAKRGRPSAFKPEYCDRVVDYMAQGFSATAFAGSIKICRDTLHQWQKEHPEFSDAIKKGAAARVAFLEGKLLQGGHVVPFIFALKNACPEEWRERTDSLVTVQKSTLLGASDELVEQIRIAARSYQDALEPKHVETIASEPSSEEDPPAAAEGMEQSGGPDIGTGLSLDDLAEKVQQVVRRQTR
jgi:hypothetical protein